MANPEAREPLLARRWVRVATGLALVGLSTALALAAWTLPFVEIRSGSKLFPLDGPTQTANLHLVLVATGALGALLALYYAITRAPVRYAFFVVGGVAAAFTGLIWVGAYDTVKHGKIADPTIYAAVQHGAVEMAVGNALWVSLGTTIAILGLAVLVWRVGAHAPPPPPPPPRRL